MHLLLVSALVMADEPDATFGGDVAVGVAGGMLFNDWVTTPQHGAVIARYDAFVVDRETPGHRIGLSMWGGGSLWPQPARTEEDERAAFSYTQYGIMTVLRADPELPIGYLAGIGFGRLDLPLWYGAPHYLPMATIEAGARRALGDRPFVDVLLRAHWAQARDSSNLGYEEWWMVQLGLMIGGHVR